MSRSIWLAVTLLCCGCTPGAFAAAGSGGNAPPSAQVTTIDVDLTEDPGGSTSAGNAAGYKPLTTVVPVGSYVQFHNSDGFAHTASSFPGTTYPSQYPFGNGALTPSGTTLSGGFSSGSLTPGAQSQPLLADKAGTYLFGCYYHYGTPMRAEINVQ
jgi:plastocyanin